MEKIWDDMYAAAKGVLAALRSLPWQAAFVRGFRLLR